MADEKGIWRTVSGRRIFIRHSQSLEEAMQSSGKFRQAKRQRRPVRLSAAEYAKVVSEINTYYHKRFEDKQIAYISISGKSGAYCYKFINHGFDEYELIVKWKID